MGRVSCRAFAKPLETTVDFGNLADCLTCSASDAPKRRGLFGSCLPLRPSDESSKEPPNSQLHLISSFSDDSIRAIYVTKEHVVAIIGNALLKRWSLTDCTNQTCAKLDRRLSSTIKYVLQRGRRVLVPSQGCTISVDMKLQQICPSYFRLTDKDLVPCDFDGEYLLIYSHYPQQSRTLKAYSVTIGGQVLRIAPTNACQWCLRLSDDPADSLTCTTLWGNRRSVVADTRGRVVLYEWSPQSANVPSQGTATQLSRGRAKKPVMAFAVQREDMLAGLTRDGVILVWDFAGALRTTIKLQGVTFDSPIPPLIRIYGAYVVFSSDSGVHMLWLNGAAGAHVSP